MASIGVLVRSNKMSDAIAWPVRVMVERAYEPTSRSGRFHLAIYPGIIMTLLGALTKAGPVDKTLA